MNRTEDHFNIHQTIDKAIYYDNRPKYLMKAVDTGYFRDSMEK